MSPDLQALLARIPDHPLSPMLRTAVSEMLGIAERFTAKKSDLARSGTHTPQGQAQELAKALPDAIKDLSLARAPIDRAFADVLARRAAIKIKVPDANNFASAIERWAIQDYVSGLALGAREALAMTTTDRRILEAIVTAPPELSGFVGNLAPTFKKAEARYLEETHGADLKSIAEAEAVLAEASAAAQISRDKIQRTVGMRDREFAAVVAPIEKKIGAPWLIKDGARTMVCEVGADGLANYRLASAREISDGVFYKDSAAYQASRASSADAPSNGAG
jgi:hypothetical protein